MAQTLLRTIEGEIIPRLLLAHRVQPASETTEAPNGEAITSEDQARFVKLVMTDTTTETRQFVDGLLRRGVSHESLFLDLLTHAARRLGELWEEDLCDFSEVTIGLCRLHEVVRERSVVHELPRPRVTGNEPRILLATACADQHVFGVVLVAEFFRRAGWLVSSEPGTFPGRLAAIVAKQRFELVGLSAACSASPDELANEIELIRKASANRKLRVMVGGRVFVEAPDLATGVGADGWATSARTAPVVANEMLGRSGVPTG
jgi:methanogenic corrinoid protein MtbC1